MFAVAVNTSLCFYTQEELLLFQTDVSKFHCPLSDSSFVGCVYLPTWTGMISPRFSCCDDTFLVCSNREHHEWLVSSSSWNGETGHPGHKGTGHTPSHQACVAWFVFYLQMNIIDGSGWYLSTFSCSQSKLCRNKPKASVRSSTWSQVTPRWRSTGKCLDRTANQAPALHLWAEPGGAGSRSREP